MSIWGLIWLTISMAGAQIAWVMELGYGTPFLLSLGLSEQLTSLVWLAGPISGLVAQPLIGAISDSSTSSWRRRYWIVTSTIALIISTLVLAFCVGIAEILVDIFTGGKAQDPNVGKTIKNTAIALAVTSFYVLDFALNALQASLRNLLLDVTPAEQLTIANAWHGRMTHAGNIIGFTLGFLDLGTWPALAFLGGDQFRKVCVVSLIVLVITIWITVATQKEEARQEEFKFSSGSELWDIVNNIYRAVLTLPKPVRRVCYVQVFSFMGWFPFLFYSTTWVGEVMAQEIDADPDVDTATRAGELAMLFYSIMAVVAGTLLPYLAARDQRLLEVVKDEREDAEIARIRIMVHSWKIEAARKGEPLKLPTMPFMLRNIWTGALLLYTAVMMSTFFVKTVFQATIAITLLGISWAVACWVPFAIIMEYLKEMDDQSERNRKEDLNSASRASGPRDPESGLLARPGHARVVSTPARLYQQDEATDRTPLIRRHSIAEPGPLSDMPMDYTSSQPAAGGTVLGIHNLAIVFPQFVVALVASAIFKAVDSVTVAPDDPTGGGYVYYGKNGVAWVLRFGGICAFVAALLTRRVPPTKTEKLMRRRRAEMNFIDTP
ncbi:MFS general substrate transporter [Dacryopinax primogenitus]|uniref:MFS general substrate transporter n=1 Tax=Dacryopinax primogenitus (strain DJM 731) TaxID=1858805 RepID=M5GFF0_DACPD|nr:MFS general substrate transporter [Dacryopinax primogenitus]EJU06217.1 MFS general substrate transporter [Dacryopinax primogenitus]